MSQRGLSGGRKPKPFTINGKSDELNLLNEIARMRLSYVALARRANQEADRLSELHDALRDRFCSDYKKSQGAKS